MKYYYKISFLMFLILISVISLTSARSLYGFSTEPSSTFNIVTPGGDTIAEAGIGGNDTFTTITTDNDKILIYYNNGTFYNSFSLNAGNTCGEGNTMTNASKIYVLDSCDNLIYKYWINGTYIGTFASGVEDGGIKYYDNKIYVRNTTTNKINYYYANNDSFGGSITKDDSYILGSINIINGNFLLGYTSGDGMREYSLSGTSVRQWDTDYYYPSHYSSTTRYLYAKINSTYFGIFAEAEEFIQESHRFTNPVYIFQSDNYQLNVTYNSSYWSGISATLNYDGTNYSTTKSGTGDSASFINTLTIPTLTVATNKTLYWNIILSNSTGNYVFNSLSYNQTVNPISVDNCTTNTVRIINYTMKDEDTQSILSGTGVNTSMLIRLDLYPSSSPTTAYSYNISISRQNPGALCISSGILNTTTYQMDISNLYTAVGYVERYNTIQNYTLNNNTNSINVTLFALASSSSQEFTITYKGSSFTPISDAIVTVAREYPAEATFKTVESPTTSDDGKAIVHLKTSTTRYNFVITKDGQTLATFNNLYAICQNPTITECTINLNTYSSGPLPHDFVSDSNLEYTLSFNRSTRTISVTFNTVDGSTSLITLNGTKFDNFGNTSACSSSVTTSSGSLSCIVSSGLGNVTVLAKLYVDGDLIEQRYFNLNQDARDIFGSASVILIILLFMTLPLIAVGSAEITILAGIFALVIGSVLNIWNGGIIGAGASVLWLVIAGGILLWKMTQR